jgi:hypothetical protein
MKMNRPHDPLQELWKKEPDGAVSAVPATLPPDRVKGKAQAERLRRRVGNDGWLKMAVLIIIPAALLAPPERLSLPAVGILAFMALSAAMGAFQVYWSRNWTVGGSAGPLARTLSDDLGFWRRRRPALAVLLGATPALAWQVYQLAYLAMNPGSAARPVNLLFLTAGGPLLWLLASWRQWARIDVWLAQIERALGAFDEEAAARYARARGRANRRTAIIAALLLLLLLAGVVSLLLAA